jgi:RHH-type rel operon transcriptional repressor/antitoxin RelB
MMAETFEVTVELPASLRDRLDEIAHAMKRPASWVVARAIESFVEIEDIKQAIAEAEAGDFASDAEVDAVFAKSRALGRDAD